MGLKGASPPKKKTAQTLGGSRGKRPAFPLRAAAVDVGSNAIRLGVAEFSSPGRFRLLENAREPVRLGHGVFLTGHLAPEVVRAALRALSSFRRRMEELDVQVYRAVATSAVRESDNGDEFLARVRKEAGLRLECINGSEEGRLIYRAVRERVGLGAGRWLLADLGGGSIEVSLVDASGILWNESHTMGAVRLLEELAGSAEDPGRLQRLITEYVETLRISAPVQEEALSGYIATGGNIETLAQMGQARPGPDGVARLPLASLEALTKQLARLSYRERVEGLGLREDRADVVFPAAMVYAKLARLVQAGEILVPGVGIKEGVLLDLVDSLADRREAHEREEGQVEQAALALGRKFRFDEAHARHVARLSLSIFDQLAPLHGLGSGERRILQAAALLHDIGGFVSTSGHHKHSLYLLTHSNLAGFGRREMAVLANVARYHRRSAPKAQHEAYAALDRPEKSVVVRLSSLLRLADAMDREHQQRVYSVKAEVKEGLLKLRLEGQGDLLLEGWSLKKKGDLLKKAFGLGLEITPSAREAP
jgi:exopolyphosphatase / guanosine-5'-triphosphate,3'-diphosphate pyrophosphatase